MRLPFLSNHGRTAKMHMSTVKRLQTFLSMYGKSTAAQYWKGSPSSISATLSQPSSIKRARMTLHA